MEDVLPPMFVLVMLDGKVNVVINVLHLKVVSMDPVWTILSNVSVIIKQGGQESIVKNVRKRIAFHTNL